MVILIFIRNFHGKVNYLIKIKSNLPIKVIDSSLMCVITLKSNLNDSKFIEEVILNFKSNYFCLYKIDSFIIYLPIY